MLIDSNANTNWERASSPVTEAETLPTVTELPIHGKLEYIREYLREKRWPHCSGKHGKPISDDEARETFARWNRFRIYLLKTHREAYAIALDIINPYLPWEHSMFPTWDELQKRIQMVNRLVLMHGQNDWNMNQRAYLLEGKAKPTNISEIPNERIRQMQTNWTEHMFVGYCPYQVTRHPEDQQWHKSGVVRPTYQLNPIEIPVASSDPGMGPVASSSSGSGTAIKRERSRSSNKIQPRKREEPAAGSSTWDGSWRSQHPTETVGPDSDAVPVPGPVSGSPASEAAPCTDAVCADFFLSGQ